MILLIAYIIIAVIASFVMVAYNEATIKNNNKKEMANINAFGIASIWPLALLLFIIVAPFWAVDTLAKWFGRNYL